MFSISELKQCIPHSWIWFDNLSEIDWNWKSSELEISFKYFKSFSVSLISCLPISIPDLLSFSTKSEALSIWLLIFEIGVSVNVSFNVSFNWSSKPSNRYDRSLAVKFFWNNSKIVFVKNSWASSEVIEADLHIDSQ